MYYCTINGILVMLRVFTAFSGYDSQCLALREVANACDCGFRWELVGWSEIDKWAIKAHNALFPQWSDRNYGDISKIDWSAVPDFDLFTYSSPCQDFSQAGKQRGGTKGSGARSSLLWECERAIRAKKPKYLLMENVAALVSSKFIKLFNQWQLTLERMGYTNFAQVLNAKTHGYPTPVPQNRERIFMVSIRKCDQPFFFPDPQPLTTRLKDVLEDHVDERYYLNNARLDGLIKSTQKEADRDNGFAFEPKTGEDIAGTLQTAAGSRKMDNYVKVKTGENCCNGCCFLQDCAGDGDGTEIEGIGCESGYIWKVEESTHTHTHSQVVLGWTRDSKGNIVDRHPVSVANAVTAGKRENTQNYVLEL